MGFYSKGVIYERVPKILKQFESVEIQRDSDVPELLDLINRIIDEGRDRKEGQYYKFIILSAPDSPDTLKLDKPIPNDKQSTSGKPTAFTMGQRTCVSCILARNRNPNPV